MTSEFVSSSTAIKLWSLIELSFRGALDSSKSQGCHVKKWFRDVIRLRSHMLIFNEEKIVELCNRCSLSSYTNDCLKDVEGWGTIIEYMQNHDLILQGWRYSGQCINDVYILLKHIRLRKRWELFLERKPGVSWSIKVEYVR